VTKRSPVATSPLASPIIAAVRKWGAVDNVDETGDQDPEDRETD
jgi:hypothetical protein